MANCCDRFGCRWRYALALTGLIVGLPAGIANPSVAAPLFLTQQPTRAPQTVTGEINKTSPRVEGRGVPYETFTFRGTAGETITAELRSDEFDAYLTLQSISGEVLENNDNGADGTNSRITATLPSSDVYVLVVYSRFVNEIGNYQLELRSATSTERDIAQDIKTIWALHQEGKYGEAIPIAEQVLARVEQDSGIESLSAADSLLLLAGLYHLQGQYNEVEPILERALRIQEQQLGLAHPDVATTVNNMALLYQAVGNYEKAEISYQRAIGIYEQELGETDSLLADSLRNLAQLYQETGRYSDSENFYQRALRIYEQQYGSQHLITAYLLNGLAELYRTQGRFSEAEFLSKEVVSTFENQAGENHPDTAAALNVLAEIYFEQGRYAEAEPLFARAFLIVGEQLGQDHPKTASALSNLAQVYLEQGRYDEAEPLFELALNINSQQLGREHPYTTTTLNNLAALFFEQGRYPAAELLYEELLNIQEQQFGDDHPTTAILLNNLAEVYSRQSRYDEAELLIKRATDIRERYLGIEHPDTVISLNSLANLYFVQGRYSDAEPIFQNILEIWGQQLGFEHPRTALSLKNLAGIYYAQGRHQLALDYLSQGLVVEEAVLSDNLIGGSDRDKRDYLATVSETMYAAISLHLTDLSNSQASTRLALTSILQRKGRVLDLFTNLRDQLTNDPKALVLLDNLSTANTQLANLIFNPPTEIPSEAYQEQLSILQQEIRGLEDQLSRQSADFANLTASPSLADIQAVLPIGTALVEFIRYQRFNPTASPQERFGEFRYAAYVLQADGTIQGLDLGAAEAIDQAVGELSISLTSPNTPIGQLKAEAKALETLVMAPVRAAFGSVNTVFIAPDSALNLIPFETLVDESGNYLVEEYQFRYLTSGRDLMRLNGTTAADNPALLIGNPNYGLPGEQVAQADTRAINSEKRIFPALPGTQTEVSLIADKLVSAEVYTQTNATEAVIKEQAHPSILHIATHGFFEPIEDARNPLLQSGLILAGAAAGGQSGPDQDGILTALEVTGMNLSGTQLVVLSACETGLGELAAGEGLYGLRRAFVLAGSQTQVISLWKVDDTATQELMVDYYDRLLAGSSRDAALRETQLVFLKSGEYSHPYYWAAFIGSGDWRPLEYLPMAEKATTPTR